MIICGSSRFAEMAISLISARVTSDNGLANAEIKAEKKRNIAGNRPDHHTFQRNPRSGKGIDQRNAQPGSGHLHRNQRRVGVQHAYRPPSASWKALSTRRRKRYGLAMVISVCCANSSMDSTSCTASSEFGRQHRDAGRLSDPVNVQPAVFQRQAHRSQIHGFRQHRLHHIFRRHALQLDLLRTKAFRQARQRRRQQPSRQRRDRYQFDLMIFFPSDVLRALANVANPQQCAFDFAVHHERLVGWR